VMIYLFIYDSQLQNGKMVSYKVSIKWLTTRVGGKGAYGLIFSIHFLNVFPVGKRPQYTDHYFSQYKKTAASHAQ